MKISSIVLTAIAVVFHSSECARILGIFPMPGISHNILTSKLMKGLMVAGHDVTIISAFPVKDASKNGTMVNIVIEGLIEKMKGKFSEIFCFTCFTKNTKRLCLTINFFM